MHQSYYLVQCYATDDINSLLISFLHTLRCFYLLYQALNLAWIIISGPSLSKLTSSRRTLLRSTLTRPISLLKNVTLSESLLTIIISSLEITTSSGFSRNFVFQAFHADQYKTQDVSDKVVDTCLSSLKFVPDWFDTNKIFVSNQLGTNFNAGRQESTTFSDTSRVFIKQE